MNVRIKKILSRVLHVRLLDNRLLLLLLLWLVRGDLDGGEALRLDVGQDVALHKALGTTRGHVTGNGKDCVICVWAIIFHPPSLN